MNEEILIEKLDELPAVAGSLTKLDWNGNQIRVTIVEGEICFLLRDVADALDIERVDNHVKMLERAGFGLAGEISVDLVRDDGVATSYPMKLITESGFYMVIGRSNKPEAFEFSKWVYTEVLPAIRKTGSYNISDATTTMPPDLLSRISQTTNDIVSYMDLKFEEQAEDIKAIADMVVSSHHPNKQKVGEGKKKKRKINKPDPWSDEQEARVMAYDCQLAGCNRSTGTRHKFSQISPAFRRLTNEGGHEYDPWEGDSESEIKQDMRSKANANQKWQVIARLSDDFPDKYPDGLPYYIQAQEEAIRFHGGTLVTDVVMAACLTFYDLARNSISDEEWERVREEALSVHRTSAPDPHESGLIKAILDARFVGDNPSELKVNANQQLIALEESLVDGGYVTSKYGAQCFLFEFERYYITRKHEAE